MTTDRFAVLADIDALLDDATAQTITEALERGESPEHGLASDQDCAWCGHDWHGLPCQTTLTPGFWTMEDLRQLRGCRCDSAMPRRDDTWRPPASNVERLMHDQGLDGWAAQAETERSFSRVAFSAGGYRARRPRRHGAGQ